MTNLTPLFQKYIDIIEENEPKKTTVKDEDDYLDHRISKDSFIKECHQLLRLLMEMRTILKSVEPQYRGESNMTEAEKDDFDTEFRLQFHQYVQKFRLLENYETERQKVITGKFLSSQAHMLHLFHGTDNQLALCHHANNEFRSGVLKSLSMWLSIVSSQFSAMQQERLASQRIFETLDLNSQLDSQTTADGVVRVSSVSLSHPVETTQEELKVYEETISKLTQEQLQMLETEHEELLHHKNEQVKKVEKINKTILDIVSLQNEISSNLEAQSQNINSILDNQDDIEINIKEGNKQLTKAKKAAGRTAKMTTIVAIILGILILFLDYVG